MSTLTVATKTCTKCDVVKPLVQFGRNKVARDGRQSWCLSCQRADKRDRRATEPAFAARDAKQRRAYQVADARLRAEHREEFERYYAEELAMRGLS